MKKIFTLLLAFIALATGMQATDYGFSIRGYRITSDNYQSMSTSAWSYDPSDNVLHLKDGTIFSDASTVIYIDGSVNPTLNVSVDGNCDFSGKFNVGISIAGNGNHTFSGNGTLSIRSSVVSSTGITVSGNNSKPSVTFKDLTVKITSYGGVGFSPSSFASITFEWCDFEIYTSDGMAMMTTFTNACTPQLTLCCPDRNWHSDNNGSGYRGISGEGLFAPKLKITRAIRYVGVKVAEPVPGQKPATTATTISSGYKVSNIIWMRKQYGNTYPMEENEVFQMGAIYQVSFDLEAQGDSLFSWDSASEAAMNFTVNGNKADYSTVDTERRAYMYYTFPALVGTSYDLWVGGTQVNDANKDNLDGNGRVKFNPSTSTLTLSNANISINEYSAFGVRNEIPNLEVVVEGDNTIESKQWTAFCAIENVHFKGSGTLRLKGYSWGIDCSSSATNITVSNGVHLICEGGERATADGPGYGGGLSGGYTGRRPPYSYKTTLKVSGSNTVFEVKGVGYSSSLYNLSNLVLNDGLEIASPAGAVWNADKHAVCDTSGNPIIGEWVVIKRLGALKGDVNLDGDVTIADGVAVLNAMAGQSVPGNPDINGDNDITIADFVAVLNIMAGQ